MNNTDFKPYPNQVQSFGIAGLTILFMLVFTPINILLNSTLGKGPSLLIYYCLSIATPILIFHFLKKKKEGHIKYNILPKELGMVIVLILTTLAIQHGVLAPLTSFLPMPDAMKKLFEEIFKETTNIYGFTTVAIAAPILEELLFRGIVLDGLLKKYSPRNAILLSSFLFGVIHLNPWQFISAFLIGIFIGYIYYHTRNVGYCILIHLTNNMTATILTYFYDTETLMSDDLYLSYGGATNFYIILGISLIILAYSILYFKRKFSADSEKNHFDTLEESEVLSE